MEPAAGVRIRWRWDCHDRRRLPRLPVGSARGRFPPRRADPLAAVGDADDERTASPGAEGCLWVLAGVFRRHGLGLWDVGPYPSYPSRPFGRELRMARLLRHRL